MRSFDLDAASYRVYVAGAEQAVRTNWRNAAERLARVIVTLGERGNW